MPCETILVFTCLYLAGWGTGSKRKLNQVEQVLHTQAECTEDKSFREETMLCFIDPDEEKGTCSVCVLWAGYSGKGGGLHSRA